MKPILALETSTSRCGVALISHPFGAESIILQELDGVTGHAESLLPLAQAVLNTSELSRNDLAAIAFDQGPGAFTGLRVACGAAQGISFALGIPVVAVGALTAMAAAMPTDCNIRMVALDARMQEVYFAVWLQTASTDEPQRFPENLGLMPLQAPVLIAIEDFLPFVVQRLPYWIKAQQGLGHIGLSGNGWSLLGEASQWFESFHSNCKQTFMSSHKLTLCDDSATPQVAWVARLGAAGFQAGKGLKPEQAAPYYLRDKVAFTSAERAQGLGGNPKVGDATRSSLPILLPMLPTDLVEVAELEQMSQSFPWSKQNFSDALAAQYPAWVVRRAGELIGFCVAMKDPDDIHVLVIAVNPDYRRQGVGSLLLTSVRQLAIQSALNRVLLEVRPSNDKALAFYQRSGFTRMGLRKGYYPAGKVGREDAWVLSCSVDCAIHTNVAA
jgi:tRNA threonylcarbamoyladenosine biosynthesis protein TsaB